MHNMDSLLRNDDSEKSTPLIEEPKPEEEESNDMSSSSPPKQELKPNDSLSLPTQNVPAQDSDNLSCRSVLSMKQRFSQAREEMKKDEPTEDDNIFDVAAPLRDRSHTQVHDFKSHLMMKKAAS